ncbi:MAG TPA: hypothetical protein VMV04_12370, partial [Thermodesulfobacteriota bacterium]|nr:hypothetical protein [Thermodesulfobacteriota bacterium]
SIETRTLFISLRIAPSPLVPSCNDWWKRAGLRLHPHLNPPPSRERKIVDSHGFEGAFWHVILWLKIAWRGRIFNGFRKEEAERIDISS